MYASKKGTKYLKYPSTEKNTRRKKIKKMKYHKWEQSTTSTKYRKKLQAYSYKIYTISKKNKVQQEKNTHTSITTNS